MISLIRLGDRASAVIKLCRERDRFSLPCATCGLTAQRSSKELRGLGIEALPSFLPLRLGRARQERLPERLRKKPWGTIQRQCTAPMHAKRGRRSRRLEDITKNGDVSRKRPPGQPCSCRPKQPLFFNWHWRAVAMSSGLVLTSMVAFDAARHPI